MNTLRNNHDLFTYLLSLSALLAQRGAEHLSEMTRRASHFATGSSSEFLGEAELVLIKVKGEHRGVLNPSEVADIEQAVGQIREAFNKVGGA